MGARAVTLPARSRLHASAALRWLFQDVPFDERLALAARAGFGGVDFSVPYAIEPRALRARLDELGLAFTCLLAAPGDWASGEMGTAAIPGREQEFRDGFERAIAYALEVGCRLVHAAAGHRPAAIARERCRDTYLENLAFACALARRHRVSVGIEPVCRQRHPQFFLNRFDEAIDLRSALGSPAELGVIVDTHHVAMEGDSLIDVIEAHADAIVYFQVADPPQRHEPGAGSLAFDPVFDALERSAYQGWVSAEYAPTTTTTKSLAWARRFGVRPAGE
jgi:hydroxypyruvate isomerase